MYNKLNFQELTPSRIENMSYYNEALDFAFKNPDILNIAITGAYGAGKSSLIKTYKDLHKERKFIHISLTNFEKNEDNVKERNNDNGDKKIKRLDESELEGKILNQLIYQINPINIPQTKFKVKKDIKLRSIIKETIIMSLFLISLLYILKFQELEVFIGNLENAHMVSFLNILIENETFIFSAIMCFSIFVFYIFRITRAQLYNPIFKKVKWQNNEIEVFQNDEESHFNKHLDEILYLFRNSDVDVIVFEDIDRYDNNIIFSKLREINELINNNKEKGRPIRFLYLIRDDIFTSKDRTKFFDFILPVIPVIDSSNSYDKILETFGQAGLLKSDGKTFLSELDDFFLRDISLYIDDMRLLKNIYNEYVIYYGRLQITEIELDLNKLLALIVYKNIFPNDFIDLQLNKGFVFNIFENKGSYIKVTKTKIDLLIDEKQKNIKAIEDEQLTDLDELDTLYVTSGQYNYKVNNKFDNGFKTRLEYIKSMKQDNAKVEQYNSNGYGGYGIIDINNRIKMFNEESDYVKRKNLIIQKINNGIEILENEIEELELEKRKIGVLKMRELINNDYVDINELFEYNLRDEENNLIRYKHIISNHYYPLIKYLIRNGHIDETYFDYLSYFYENGLARDDKIFLRSITDEEPKDFNYKLKDPEKVITYLKPRSLEQKEALNFDLLKHLLDNIYANNNQEYLDHFFRQIREDRRFDFIFSYIVQASNTNILVKKLNIFWQEIFVFLISNKEIEGKKKKVYMVHTLHYSSLENIQKMNIESCITTYISNNENFLDIDNPDVNKIINIFISLDIYFKNIDFDSANKDLFKEVYNNNLYELNLSMIRLILEKVYNIPIDSDFIEKNYTLISSKPNAPLKDYIDRNINDYMKLIFTNLSDKFNDSEGSVIDILNNPNIEDDNKTRYIQNLSTIIIDVEDIENTTLWEELFKNNTIYYSTKNILTYYFKYSEKMDSTITRFINANPNEIEFDYNSIKEDHGEGVSKFFRNIIKNNELINEKYKMILRGFNRFYSEFNISEINDEKFEILIELGIIGMTKENIKFVRANYPDLMIFFIINDIQDYIDCLDEEVIIEEEILELLNEESLLDSYKISLAKIFPGNIIMEDSNYNEALELYIINNKFDSSDLNYIINNYNNSSTEMKRAITEICIQYIDEISSNEYNLYYDLLLELTTKVDIDSSYKKIIISDNFDTLNSKKVIQLMIAAKFDNYVKLFGLGKRQFDLTVEDKNLLECFKDKGWIKNYYKNDSYYYAYGRKHQELRKKLANK